MPCDLVHLPAIHPNLYLGSMRAAQTCAPPWMRILCVANGSTCDQCRGKRCAGAFDDVPDDFLMSKRDFDAFTVPAAEALHTALKQGPTLVHCYAGINRSSSVIAKYAIDYRNMDPDQTIAYLRQRNRTRQLPALSNFTFASYLTRQPNLLWLLLFVLLLLVFFFFLGDR